MDKLEERVAELEEKYKMARHHINNLCEEVVRLRNDNRIKSARLGVFDDMMQILNSQPARLSNPGLSEDIVWLAQDFIKEKVNSK